MIYGIFLMIYWQFHLHLCWMLPQTIQLWLWHAMWNRFWSAENQLTWVTTWLLLILCIYCCTCQLMNLHSLYWWYWYQLMMHCQELLLCWIWYFQCFELFQSAISRCVANHQEFYHPSWAFWWLIYGDHISSLLSREWFYQLDCKLTMC